MDLREERSNGLAVSCSDCSIELVEKAGSEQALVDGHTAGFFG